MIRANSITIEKFRGIQNLTIDFSQKNYAVCGPNGTGKSGIVDALEFALTGNISRLSGKGTGNINLKDHAPHVDSRNRPDLARVILTVFIPHLNIEVKIDRNVKDYNNPTITPNTPEIVKVLKQVALHPEFVLSRRELIKYVLSAPSDRAKEVQILLRLDDVENLRAIFNKISNGKQKEIAPLLREKNKAKEQLLAALNITELNSEKVLTAVNIHRTILGLPQLSNISSTTSLKDGLATTTISQTSKIIKLEALNEIKKLEDFLIQINGAEITASVSSIVEELGILNEDPTFTSSISREEFLKKSIALIDEDTCPLCDKPIAIEELKALIGVKLKKFDETSRKRLEIQKQIKPLSLLLEDIGVSLSTICNYGPLLSPQIDIKVAKSFKNTLDSNCKQFEAFTPLPETINSLKNSIVVPADVTHLITAIKEAILALPDATKQDVARDFLTIAQERLEYYRQISLQHKKAEDKAALAKQVYETYAQVSTTALESIYKQVEKDFSDLYRDINKDDEGTFTAQLVPSSGKLGLDVDFFGRGFFPPGAYHSEGHQDSMGICLYLALMRHLLKDSFTFAVLDDVLMSVDAGHRREVCNMLKKHFPKTQFIFTTHDDIWLEHMKNAGLVTRDAAIQFRTWDVDNGPTKWDNRDIWQQIKDEAAKNDIRSAASLLRHYLEHISAELCHRLKASVPFRADARYELGDLLPAAVSRFKKLLKEGKATAQSWGKTEDLSNITIREETFSQIVEASKVEQWMINAAVHYNNWANFQAADFIPVIDAYEKLIGEFVCAESNCGSILYVLPERGNQEMLRCFCGSTIINLLRKKADNRLNS